MSAATPAAWQILECLGVTAAPGCVTVHVKAPGQLFGLSLERALCRIEEFTEPSQDIVVGAISLIYSIPKYRVTYVTAEERMLIKNFRALDKASRISMWEAIDDLAESAVADVGQTPAAKPQRGAKSRRSKSTMVEPA